MVWRGDQLTQRAARRIILLAKGAPNKRLERTRQEGALLVSCVGEPLKRRVIRTRLSDGVSRRDALRKEERRGESTTAASRGRRRRAR
jgi:hypothetical protein